MCGGAGASSDASAVSRARFALARASSSSLREATTARSASRESSSRVAISLKRVTTLRWRSCRLEALYWAGVGKQEAKWR